MIIRFHRVNGRSELNNLMFHPRQQVNYSVRKKIENTIQKMQLLFKAAISKLNKIKPNI